MSKNINGKDFLKMICILIILAIIMFVFFDTFYRKNKAKNIAVNYLESVYAEQMNFIKVRLSLIDPSMYHVYFTPQNNPELLFEVLVMLDFTLPRNSPDNYLLKYFGYHFVNDIQSMVDDLEKEKSTIRIIILNQPLYSFIVSKNIKEGMSYEKMEPYIDYDLCFDFNKKWEDADRYAEAYMMLEVIGIIQESGYSPKHINFLYHTGTKKEKYFIFSEWDKINNVSQIDELLD